MLELAVLGLLVDTDLHGYELKKRLSELLGPWSSVSFGSLYPALARLERNGLVATVTDPPPTPPEPTPMSGSLGAELAAYRAPHPHAVPAAGRRARKVYAITDAGRGRARSPPRSTRPATTAPSRCGSPSAATSTPTPASASSAAAATPSPSDSSAASRADGSDRPVPAPLLRVPRRPAPTRARLDRRPDRMAESARTTHRAGGDPTLRLLTPGGSPS